MPKNKIHELVMLGILTGLAVLLSYVFAIQTPFVRITFGFLPIALAGAFYGPWKAGLVGALDNLIGTAIIGTSIFFPGFTLSDFLTGFLFGWFFYHKEIRFPYVCVPFLLVMLLIHLGLNTLWLSPTMTRRLRPSSCPVSSRISFVSPWKWDCFSWCTKR